MRKSLVALTFLVGLGACNPDIVPTATPEGFAISPELEDFLINDYLIDPGATILFVSADGEYARSSYCPDHADVCIGNAVTKVMEDCKRVSGQTCYVLAEGRRVRPYTVKR